MSVKGSGVQYTYNGFTGNLTEWSEKLGVPRNTLFGRLLKFGQGKDAMPMVFSPKRHFWMRAATFIKYNGETRCIQDWAKKAGITAEALGQRLRKGYTMTEAMRREPKYGQGGWQRLHGGRRVRLDGIEANMSTHARRLGIPYSRIKDRVASGMSAEEAITKPKMSQEERLERCRESKRANWRRNQSAALRVIL